MNNLYNINNQSNTDETEQLIGQLQKEDKRYAAIIKPLLWLYGLMIPVYLLMSFFDPDLNIYERFSEVCFALSFVVFFFMFRYYVKVFTSVNYGEPLTQLLHSVIKRYGLWTWPTPLVIIPVLLMDVGLCLSQVFDKSGYSVLQTILHTQLLYIPLMTVSYFVGYFIWIKRYKPMVVKAKKLLQELE